MQLRQTRAAQRLDLVIYGVTALIACAVLVGLAIVVVGDSREDGEARANAGALGDCEEAHLDPTTGTAAGLACDDRTGGRIPPIQLGDPERAAKAAGCRLETHLRSEGDQHVPPSIPIPYRTDPPTSGPMYDATIADGAYLTTPPAPHVVHSLEHGRVAIQYDPTLPESAQLALKSISDEAPTQVLLFPNRGMKPLVAATAWTKLLACSDYTPRVLDALRAFRDVYRDEGPETSTGLAR